MNRPLVGTFLLINVLPPAVFNKLGCNGKSNHPKKYIYQCHTGQGQRYCVKGQTNDNDRHRGEHPEIHQKNLDN